METPFDKDERLKRAYLDFMSEYRTLKHMILASEAPVFMELDESFFLPHVVVASQSFLGRDSSIGCNSAVVVLARPDQ